MAATAFAVEEQPAEHGDVVVRLDWRFASRTFRTRRDDGNSFRNARDANIQKAADTDAEEEKEKRDHSFDCATGGEVAQRGALVALSDD